LSQTETAAVLTGGKEAPSLFLIIKPEEKAYPILANVSRRSAKELTAKDLWDFFGNLGVLVHFGPGTAEMLTGDGSWKELVPKEYAHLEAVREFYTGGRAGDLFLLIFVIGPGQGGALDKWRELIGRIIGKFY